MIGIFDSKSSQSSRLFKSRLQFHSARRRSCIREVLREDLFLDVALCDTVGLPVDVASAEYIPPLFPIPASNSLKHSL